MAFSADDKGGFEYFSADRLGSIESRRTGPGCYRTYAEAVAMSAIDRANTIAELESRIAHLKKIGTG